VQPAPTDPQCIPRLSIALISASALADEILLMRLFSISQWHHFAYMIISLALLGYGASGTFLALAGTRLQAQFRASYVINCVLFGSSALLCYLAAQQVGFNPEEVLWDPQQPVKLLAVYLLLALPFFFAANCIALALSRYRQHISRVYAADLFGAGLGSLGIVVLLFVFMPDTSLKITSALALAAAAVAWWELQAEAPHTRRWGRAWPLLLLPLLPLLLPATWTTPLISPYKGLSQTLQIGGTQIIAEHSSPLGLLSVVESPLLPLRYAPGLSLQASSEPPPQLGVFTDGDAMTAITRYTGKSAGLEYLDQLTWALPYHLNQPERVLVLGAGGGSEVLQALTHDASAIDAVEMNPQMARLVSRDYADFAGRLYERPEVKLHIAEARGFIAGSRDHYDLIQLALLDSFAASSAGLYALSENYLYTVEAVAEYLRHLNPGGYLVMSRWIKLPPRDALKLFAISVEALKRAGVQDPGQRLVLIRGWQTSTLLIKNGPVSATEIAALRTFCAQRGFDVGYYPGMAAVEANRHNILRQPYFYRAATALLGTEPQTFLQQYKFDLTPASDDRPYFFKFFKWQALPELLALRGQGGLPLLESGYLILVATLVQALLVSVVLILLPLWFYRRHRRHSRDNTQQPGDISRSQVLVFFFAVGLAFLFLEIAFIQKFILFLSHPLYAVAVVLSAFLVFAGVGSRYSKHWQQSKGGQAAAIRAVAAIGLLGLLYVLLLDTVFGSLMFLPAAVKVPIAIVLIAPLAFAMGMPFPLALAELGARSPMLIPWAWAVNGCASVLSAVLATLLAIHFGFTVVVLLALMLYGVAAKAFPRG
jgi:SAM-dependent methyltransferase